MNSTQTGWMLFVAAIGAMATLMAVEITNLQEWHFATTPEFVGKALAHVGTVIGAFVGGRLIPTKGGN